MEIFRHIPILKQNSERKEIRNKNLMFVFPFIIILYPRCCGSTLFAALKSLALKLTLKAK